MSSSQLLIEGSRLRTESKIILFLQYLLTFCVLSIISVIWKDWHNWKNNYQKNKIKEISEKQNMFNQIIRPSDTELELLRFLRKFQ